MKAVGACRHGFHPSALLVLIVHGNLLNDRPKNVI
jgi:hypothetical protein